MLLFRALWPAVTLITIKVTLILIFFGRIRSNSSKAETGTSYWEKDPKKHPAMTTGVEMVVLAATCRKEEGNRTQDISVSVLSLIFFYGGLHCVNDM